MPSLQRGGWKKFWNMQAACNLLQNIYAIEPLSLWFHALKDWHVLDRGAQWRASVGNRSSSPLHPCHIPLMQIPGLGVPEYVYPDSCHCFHIGFGKDLAASSIVLLAKKRQWPGRSLESRMEHAFVHYMDFINRKQKCTSCDGFSKLHFKMSSNLVRTSICINSLRN